MKRLLSLLALAVGLAGTAAVAQPSIYYLWKNKTSGAKMCEPQAPGPGWEKVGGPFSDENCSIPHPE
ncbi:hypothetical protein V4F39_22740 [Aquincola sp. MAHUQ-54]|uniref:Secreted protein n=1 Tax=Aquincola agrisoli TaxID=3119538 RepID=A0AAW9QQ75_9BURK